ncbi:MAG TPA: putative sulfate exporter family transporter [Gemmatimonadaceae bacterium]|nr:putative sulfate exporter family transporter [Gemmatimonadaceae bacterium]
MTSATTTSAMPAPRGAIGRFAPGILLCAALAAAAYAGQSLEERWLGHALFEALVLAILLGVAARTLWVPGARMEEGIRFSAKQVLELAVCLLGASVDLPTLLRAGPMLLAGIGVTVVLGIIMSYGISRALGLRHRLALLVACGNSICGNSAIAAVAPVVHAEHDDVASAIAFTAVLGVVMVLVLPAVGRALGLSDYRYGVIAGLTVYAVPQVMAATFPVSALSGQVGTLVKLARVLLLGPVVLVLALTHRRAGASEGAQGARLEIGRYVPWFIVGFLALAVARSLGWVPERAVAPVRLVTTVLTIISMAAMGLGVDVRGLARAGARVTAAVSASLVVLLIAALTLVHLLRIG